MSSPSVVSVVRFTRSLVFRVVFCRSLFVLWSLYFDNCLSFCHFTFDHCIVCPFAVLLLTIVLLVLLPFYFGPLYCLSFGLRFLIAPSESSKLVSSSFICIYDTLVFINKWFFSLRFW